MYQSSIDTEQEQISYHFVPIFLNFMQKHEPMTLVNLNIIHSYDEELALALKMELEDCAFSNLTSCNTISITSSTCEALNSSKYIFAFDHLDRLKEHSNHFNEESLLIVHLVGSQKNIEFNHKLETIGHSNVVTTLSQSYELAVKASLAKELSGKHSSNVDLKINSSQIKNVGISGQVGIDGEWEIDLSNCQICDIENSAISGHNGYCRPLSHILIDQKFVDSQLKKIVDERLLKTPFKNRLVSESFAALNGFRDHIKS